MAIVDLAKITGASVLEVATPEDVADTYESNDDTNKYTDDEVTKLGLCKPTIIVTQTEYDAIVLPDNDTIYIIRPEV